jgi:exodeoxyribonuclease X
MIVIDTETTGMGDKDEVVEIAAIRTPTEGQRTVFFSALVKPTVPIGLEAMSIHHITNEMVAREACLAEVLEFMPLGGQEYIAAHNAEFDKRYLPQLRDMKWICTWRCASHIWPDAPGHSNQILRYWLGITLPDWIIKGYAPHRALYDAYTTALILEKMLETRSAEALFLMSTMPVVLTKVRFGKFKGQQWKEVPRWYLEWVMKQDDIDNDVKYTADYYLKMSRR